MHHHYYISRQEQYIFISPYSSSQHADIVLVAFVFPAVIGLLQLKYQGSNESPFQTHPIKMFFTIASFLIFCFSYDAKLRISSVHPPPNSNYAKMVQIVGSDPYLVLSHWHLTHHFFSPHFAPFSIPFLSSSLQASCYLEQHSTNN